MGSSIAMVLTQNSRTEGDRNETELSDVPCGLKGVLEMVHIWSTVK